MTVRNIAQVLFTREVLKAKSDSATKSEKKSESQSSKPSSIDKANISNEAKQIFAKELSTAGRAQQVGGIGKAENLDVVKKRIEEGYYDDPKIAKEIASSILKSGDIREHDGALKTETIKERISSDYYDKPEVVDEIAKRFLRDL